METRSLIFINEAECRKFLAWVHACGCGNIDLFTTEYPQHFGLPARNGIPGYSAEKWDDITDCKHHTRDEWLVPMNDHRIDDMMASQPFLVEEYHSIFSVSFENVDIKTWKQ